MVHHRCCFHKFIKMNLFYCVLIICIVVVEINGLSFRLAANSKKCLKEEIHQGVLVTGEYDSSDAPDQKLELQVTDTKGHTLVHREDSSKGKFAFTTETYDIFEICFLSKMSVGGHGSDREISLNMKRGVEAKSYDAIAESAKLKPLEVELRRLEDLSDAIVKDFSFMRTREEEMRDTNESTNSRVLYFSIFSMCCLLGLATWQVLYLRRFFKAKKLIE